MILSLERGEGREKERGRNSVWLPLACPQLGTWPATQACALTGTRTSDLLFCWTALTPLSHTSQRRDFLCTSCPHTCTASPVGSTPIRTVQLSQWNLRPHIIATLGLEFILGFHLGSVHAIGVDRCAMTCSHCQRTQSHFPAPKPSALPLHPSLSSSPWRPCLFYSPRR